MRNLVLALVGVLFGPPFLLSLAQEMPEKKVTVLASSPVPIEVKLNSGQLATRYRIVEDKTGKTTTSLLEDRLLFDVNVNFFKDGLVRLNFQGGTGASFIGSWNPTNAGPTGTNDSNKNYEFNLRRLNLTVSPFRRLDDAGNPIATPLKSLDVTAGSMAPEFGAGSEDSYLDEDGYIMGYRARVATDKKGYLVVTGGYLGDFTNPDVFDRFGRDRMKEFNYLQILLNRSIGEIVTASLDYNRLDDVDYLRSAIKLDVTRFTRFIDSLVIEDITLINNESDFHRDDYASQLAFKINKKFKDIFGSDRDLGTTLAYIYRNEGVVLPTGDKVFFGNQLRLSLNIPNLVVTRFFKLVPFVHFVQSLDDTKARRFEVGLQMLF